MQSSSSSKSWKVKKILDSNFKKKNLIFFKTFFKFSPAYKESDEMVNGQEISNSIQSNVIPLEKRRRRSLSELTTTTEDSKEDSKNFKQFPVSIPQNEHVPLKRNFQSIKFLEIF